MTKEIYIIRHGETELNRLGIVQGRGVDSDLNDTGRAQAEAFYNRYKDIQFDKIYTSALKRTHQTVQQFIDLGLPWEQHEGIDELAWGLWEGQPNTPEARHAFLEIVEKWQGGNYEAKFEGGESPNDVMLRMHETIELIKSRTEEKRILVCMHGRAMRLLLCMLLKKPFSEMGDFPHQNTTLYKMEYADGHFSVIDFNNTDHLKD
ncbi:histidine phosphatase family protein [Pedobacter frigiditerrae]|uniref:Histidine phosphatase family protein n=1 Tax=Pedobacter frigiditerrae TaxID=2530452 RepID=A0A4R0MWE6_9SPHI|nr:histidine phosphatase family protein [Pedobacter frigiditerrae]TCC90552.1 histidine phosphatase family protein [Pedobacter frigiditerrae]